MITKPTELPEWASSGVNVVEPSANTKSDGHLSGKQPIPQYENWRARNVYQWLQYLSQPDTVQVPIGTPAGDTLLTVAPGTPTASKTYGIQPRQNWQITAIRARISQTGMGVWQASTAYVVGNRVLGPVGSSSHVYECAAAGTTGGTGPSGTTSGQVDGSVTWNYVGELAGANVGTLKVELVSALEGTLTTLAASPLCTQAAGAQTLAATGLTVNVASNTAYYLTVADQGCGGTSTIYALEYDVTPK